MKKVARFILEKSSKHPENPLDRHLVVIQSLLMGTLAGSIGSLAGIGGSIIIIPFLTMYLNLSSQLAHGTSMAVALGTSVGGTISYLRMAENDSGSKSDINRPDMAGSVHLPTAFALASMGTVMATVGARVSKRLPERQLKLAFASCLLVSKVSFPIAEQLFCNRIKISWIYSAIALRVILRLLCIRFAIAL
jgi:hypothetical protein